MLIYVDLVHSFLVLCGILLHEPLYNSAFLLLMDIEVFLFFAISNSAAMKIFIHIS